MNFSQIPTRHQDLADLFELSAILEAEVTGGSVDRGHAAELARRIAADHPSIRQSMLQIADRMDCPATRAA